MYQNSEGRFSMFNYLELKIPNTKVTLHEKDKVKLGRFDTVMWRVMHGWYSWGGNRPVCGWYLINIENPKDVKPLQLTDLDDIYILEH